MAQYQIIKNILAVAVIGSAMTSLGFAADCDRVSPPPLPDASLVTANQMVHTQEAVKAYVQANTAYLSCTNSVNKKNRAFKEIKKVAKAYNRLLASFQARVASGEVDQGSVSVLAMQ